jgi:putative phosphoesterase
MSHLIGIISDTHDQVHYLPKVIEFFNEKQIQRLVHCGDWISPFTLAYYQVLNVPIYGVYGNNDGDKFMHQRVAQRLGLNLTMEDQLIMIDVADKKLAAYHGTSAAIVEALVTCGKYDIVCYGHNHIAKIELSGSTLSFNPGTLMDVTTPQVQGASIGLYNAETHMAEIIWLKDLVD